METKRDTGRKGMLVSHICRHLAALCLDFLVFITLLQLGTLYQPKCGYMASWE